MLKILPFFICSCLSSQSPSSQTPSSSPSTPPTLPPGTCFSQTELDYIYAFIGPRVARPAEHIVIDLGNWYTSILSGNVALILLKEVLGYKIVTVKYASAQDPDVAVQRLANNVTDLNFEVWLSKDGPGQFQPSVQQYLDKFEVFSAGTLGATGTQGWFVPTALVKDMLAVSVDMDFWRTYSTQRASSPEAYSALNTGGKVNDSLWVAPPFIPLWCMVGNNRSAENITLSPVCPEIVALTPEWGEGVLPQIIVNNQFRFQVGYVGNNIDEVVIERVTSKPPRSVIFYSWTPSQFMTKYANYFTRVALPPFSETCYANNTRDPRGMGSVNCDYPPVPIFKMYGRRLQELSTVQSSTQQNAYQDLMQLLNLFSLETSDLEWMLSRMDSEEDGFVTACKWLKACTSKKNPTPPVWTQSPSTNKPSLYRSEQNTMSPSHSPSPPSIPPTPYTGLLTCDWFGWLRNTPMNYVQDLNAFYVVVSMIAAGVVAGITVILQLLLFKNRKNAVIRATAPRLCQVMLLGSYLACAAVVVSAQGQSYRPFCILFPTLFGCAFVLVFGSLTLKNRRIHQIFNRSPPGPNGRIEKPASDALLLQTIAAMLGGELTLNMLWFAFNSPRVELVNSSGDRAMHWSCAYEQNVVFVVIFITPKALMVLYAMWVSWKVRNVNDQFNESPKLAFSAYTTVIFGGFGLGVGVADISSNELFLINSLLILVGILSNILVLLVPKLWAIYYLPLSPNLDSARWSPSRSNSTADDPQVHRLRRRLVDSTRQIEQLKRTLKDHGLEIPLLSSVADPCSQSRTSSQTQ